MLLLSLSACGEDALVRGAPYGAWPDEIELGPVYPGQEHVHDVAVESVGTAPLGILNATWTGTAAALRFVRAAGARAQWADPGASISAGRLIFRPMVPGVTHGTLSIRSNESADPRTVAVVATAIAPALRVAPARLDFGSVPIGLEKRLRLRVENHGPLTADVTFALEDANGTFFLGSSSGSRRIAAQGFVDVEVGFRPAETEEMRARLGVELEASSGTRWGEALLVGRGDASPVAVASLCRGAPSHCLGAAGPRTVRAAPGEQIWLDPTGSFDPEGALTRATWRWSHRPADSEASIAYDVAGAAPDALASLRVDAPGDYELWLEVEDAAGGKSRRTERAEVQIRPRDVAVALHWDISADLDLHVVRPGGRLGDYGSGAAGTSTGSDCSALNRAPDWGVRGEMADDPHLIRDVVSGRGPERFAIDDPEQAGYYALHAHYCGDPAADGPADVYAEVFIRGRLVARIPSDGTYRLRPGERWGFARLRWSGSDGDDPVEARPGAFPEFDPGLCHSVGGESEK